MEDQRGRDVIAGMPLPTVQMVVKRENGRTNRITCTACGDTATEKDRRTAKIAAKIHAEVSHGAKAVIVGSTPTTL